MQLVIVFTKGYNSLFNANVYLTVMLPVSTISDWELFSLNKYSCLFNPNVIITLIFSGLSYTNYNLQCLLFHFLFNFMLQVEQQLMDLRVNVNFAFFLTNAMFITIVFVLQLNSGELSVKW